MPDSSSSRRSVTSTTFDSPTPPALRRGALLTLDPELGRWLSAERHERARVELRARVLRRRPGPWLVDGTAADTDADAWLLILEGVVARDVRLEDVTSTELLGSGDVIRPATVSDADPLLGDQVSWSVLAECRVAVIDARCAQGLAGYPEVTTVLLERLERRSQRLARAQAIVALTRVDRRLLAMLWQLAERWGRVTSDGVLIALDISHRLLGQLVGARRPTIATAAAELARQGLLRRRDDGAWLLLGEVGLPAASHPSTPVAECGVPTGLDSGDPRWRR